MLVVMGVLDDLFHTVLSSWSLFKKDGEAVRVYSPCPNKINSQHLERKFEFYMQVVEERVPMSRKCELNVRQLLLTPIGLLAVFCGSCQSAELPT